MSGLHIYVSIYLFAVSLKELLKDVFTVFEVRITKAKLHFYIDVVVFVVLEAEAIAFEHFSR